VRIYLGVVLCAALMPGCSVAEKAAVTSYRVATAPVRLVTRQFKDEPPESDRPPDERTPRPSVARATPKPERMAASHPHQTPAPKLKSASATTPSSTDFPIARPVPGKTGYVYSPYESGKYVDVSGYTSGSKVKDPYAQKIFIVP
jgi:hypothetical protein